MDIRLVQPALPQLAPRPVGNIAATGGNAAALPKPATAEDVTIQLPIQDQTSDEARRAMVQKAAQNLTNNYVVSDVKFTIFKDLSGEYITRFTNLKDGRVSYIPEYNLLNTMKLNSSDNQQLLNIDA